MKFNYSYLAQFVGGNACFYLAYRILQAGNAGGFIFESKGGEAQLNAVLLTGVGLYLFFLPFRVDPQKAVTWRDIIFMLGLILSTEVVAHFFALIFS